MNRFAAKVSGLSKTAQWLIETKLLPPTLKARQVARPRLLNRLRDICNLSCVVIHAPAGYGKTTLLRQLYTQSPPSFAAIAWLSLDEDDRELSQFYTYLLAAVERAKVIADPHEGLLLLNSDRVPVQQLVGHFNEIVSRFKKNLLLVLDDYHNAESETINQFFQAFLNHLPENITLIISSRTFPNLALESLRAQELVIDIDAAELRFDAAEAEQIVADSVSNVVTDELLQRTEGWPIALGMVNQMLANGLLDENSIVNISGRTSELAAYITEQVLPSLSDAENSFLMQTSLLNRFTGDLADALSDEYDGWQVLEELAHKELFLIPLDNEGRWYRYHQMFCEYLRERMQRVAGKKIPDLHRRAATWLFDNHFIPEALEHAIKSGDLEMAAAMLEEVGGWRLIYEGKLEFISSMLDRLPRRLIKAHPRLIMADILRLIKLGEMSYVERLIKELRAETKDFTQWQGKPIDAELKLDFFAAIDMTYGDYTDEPVTRSRVDNLEEYSKSIDPRDHILNALINDALAYHAIDSGNLSAAVRYLDSAQHHYQKFNSFYGIIYLYFHRARIQLDQGKICSAKEVLDGAKTIAEEYLGADKGMLLRTNIYRAEVAYLCNELDECERYIADISNAFEEYDGWFDLYASAYLTKSSLHRRQLGLNASLEVLDRARVTSYERKLPRLAQLADLAQINNMLLSGNLEDAKALAVKFNIFQYLETDKNPDNISVYIPTFAATVISRLWIMTGQLQDALTLLGSLADELEGKKLTGPLISVWLLLGKAWFLKDKPDYATDFISRAVNAAMHEGFKAAFIEEGEAIKEVYQLTLDKSSSGAPNRYFNAFLTDVIQIIHAENRALDNLVSSYDLTEKEIAVVRELARGMSNKEIARLLFVSPDAVKYRLKKIFAKWQVGSRDELVRLAVERGLVNSD